MALIYEGMPCPLCQKSMGLQEDLFVTRDGIFPRGHPFNPLCDTAMHWNCYERWPHRAEFSRAYFQMQVRQKQSISSWAIVFLSEDVLVSVGFVAGEVAIWLAETGSDIRVPLFLWNFWIRSKWLVLRKKSSRETRDLAKVWPVLRTEFPNTRVLMNKANQNAKK